MSVIRFSSKYHKSVDISGSERYYVRDLCFDLLFSVLHIHEGCTIHKGLRRFIPQEPFSKPVEELSTKELRSWLRYAPGASLIDSNIETLVVNTAIVVGDPVIQFLAVLYHTHNHCIITRDYSKWFASLLSDGIASGILKHDAGWEALNAHMIGRGDDTIVCSCLPGPVFPHAGMLKSDHEINLLPRVERTRVFNERSVDINWDECMNGLTTQGDPVWITPESIKTKRGHGKSAFDIMSESRG